MTEKFSKLLRVLPADKPSTTRLSNVSIGISDSSLFHTSLHPSRRLSLAHELVARNAVRHNRCRAHNNKSIPLSSKRTTGTVQSYESHSIVALPYRKPKTLGHIFATVQIRLLKDICTSPQTWPPFTVYYRGIHQDQQNPKWIRLNFKQNIATLQTKASTRT